MCVTCVRSREVSRVINKQRLDAVITPVWGMQSCMGGPTWYHRVAVGEPYLFLWTFSGKTYRLATIRYRRQTDRQTDTTLCHRHDRYDR